MREVKKFFLYFVLLTSVIGVTYSLINIYNYHNTYKLAEEKYESLSNLYEQGGQSNKEQIETKLADINEDYIGWISVDGTSIHYPVVLGNDNDFYLNHNFHNEEDSVGAVFMDYRNSGELLGENTILYGHNMKDGSMFSSLKNVLEDDFEKKNRVRFEFQGNVYEWEIISSYVTRNTDWMQVDFDSEKDYSDFKQHIKSNAKPPIAEDVKAEKIITLATCTSHIHDERVVVQAKLVEDE